MHDDDESVVAALRAGALGYLVKGADSAEIVRAVRAVAAGEAVYGASVARRILAFHSGTLGGDPFPDLTPREREVLGELAGGARNNEIAARLGCRRRRCATMCPVSCQSSRSPIAPPLRSRPRTRESHPRPDCGQCPPESIRVSNPGFPDPQTPSPSRRALGNGVR